MFIRQLTKMMIFLNHVKYCHYRERIGYDEHIG